MNRQQHQNTPRAALGGQPGGDPSSPPKPTLSVVVPVYNERRTILELISRVRSNGVPAEIIVVDDSSTDGTRELLAGLPEQADLRIFRHDRNRGKGAALQTGFRHVRGEIVVIQDADLEYDPAQYGLLIEPIVVGAADVVYGSRFSSAGSHGALYFGHFLANRFLTTLSNLCTGLHLTDMETCYKVFRREVIADIGPTLRENGFGIDPEITAKVARRNYRVREVAVSYVGRSYHEGKKIHFLDALRVVWAIFRYTLC